MANPTQQAARIVQAQYRPIDYALANSSARNAKQQKSLAAAGRALIAQLQAGVKPAGAAYDAALHQQQALAQGGANLLGSLSPGATVQETLKAIGAPIQQQANLGNQIQRQFAGQGGVLNVEQGTVPGASLIAQKAGAQQYLAGLPTVAALGQQQAARSLAAQALAEQQGLYGQRLSAAAQIPQLALSIGQNRAAQQQALASANAEAAYRAAELNQRASSQQNLNAYRQQSLRQRRSGSSSAPKTVGFGNTLYRVNPDGTLTTLAKKGSGVSGSTSDFSATKVQQYMGDATAIAAAARRGLPEQGTPGSASYKKALPAITYDQAIREMEKHGIPLPIAVRALNRVYPSQYRVTKRGLKQTGIKQGLK